MGIDRWKQEHRNWRPSGVKLVVPDAQREEPSPTPAPSEKTSGPKPRVVKKPTGSSSNGVTSAIDKAVPKRSK
jgi:hypothetical protein